MRWFGRLLTHPSPPTNRPSLLPLSLVLLCFAGSLTPPLKQKQCFLPRPSSKNHSAGVPPANANCMQVTSHKPRVVLQPTRPIKVRSMTPETPPGMLRRREKRRRSCCSTVEKRRRACCIGLAVQAGVHNPQLPTQLEKKRAHARHLEVASGSLCEASRGGTCFE